MMERRTKRSSESREAMQYLVEALADRSDARAVALVDDGGRVVAGVGMPRDLIELRELAAPVARAEVCDALSRLDTSTDVFSRRVAFGSGGLYLAALGTRMRRFGDAANAVSRIAREAPVS
jgi:hypothetical protein